MIIKGDAGRYLGAGLLSLTLGISSATAIADDDDHEDGKLVRLIHVSDVHGHIVPHDENFLFSGNRENAGGVARLATAIKHARQEVNKNKTLTFMVGDATHGSAETTFTLGDAIMPVFNALELDGFLPGNWDFAFGPRVFRNRYVPAQQGTVKLSPNNQTTLSASKPQCNGSAGPAVCNVIPANFDTVANNVYNFNEGASGAARKVTLDPNKRPLPAFVIKEANGVKVAFIGITSTRLPVQNPLFNLSFAFTKGHTELPADIAAARDQGAEIIVLATELGLGDNIQLAKEIDGIHVILSGDTHEALPEPIIVTRKNGEKTIIVESGEDAYLGLLDLYVDDDEIVSHSFELVEVTDEVAEDTSNYFVQGGIKSLVENSVKSFYSGPDFKCHTFGNGGMAFGNGHTLCTPLDTVVGHTEATLHRRDVIGDIFNNFIGDAAVFLGERLDPAKFTADRTIGITNGFRYDIPILGMNVQLDGPDGGVSDGAITVGELYNYLPVTAAASVVEFTGGLLRGRYEDFLEGVFDPNPYRHRGGWWMGFSSNMHFVLDLENAPTSVPLSTRGGRIVDMSINGNKWDPSEIYYVMSCYPHGEATDRQCRTSGGRNMMFPCGDFNPDPNVQSNIGLCPPVNTRNIVDWNRSPRVLQVAPSNYFAPVQVLREYFKTHPVITEAEYGPARKNTTTIPYTGCADGKIPEKDKDCDGVPDSLFGEVQPVQNAGPEWLGRGDFGATVTGGSPHAH